MKKLSLLLFVLLSLGSLARAQLVTFSATINGFQEVPPNPSHAIGFATASFDFATHLFLFNDTWSGLSAPATASHIHAAAPAGSTAPVFIPFTTVNGFFTGTTSGTVSYSGLLSDEAAGQLLAGLFYVNVHSTIYPGGEIRGQLIQTSSPVPEPSTYALCGVALLGIVAWRRSSFSLKGTKKA